TIRQHHPPAAWAIRLYWRRDHQIGAKYSIPSPNQNQAGKSPPEKQTAPRVQTRIAGGSAAPPGDAKQMRLCRLILTSSTGLLDPPATSMSHNQTHRRNFTGKISEAETLRTGADEYTLVIHSSFHS